MGKEKGIQMSLYVRGDWHSCPNPLSLDPYNICELDCRFCFIKQLEQGWLKGKTKGGLKPRGTSDLERQLRNAFRSEREYKDPVIRLLRAGLPVIVGRKCEPFCPAEKQYLATRRCLELLNDFGVPAIIETRMVEGVFETMTGSGIGRYNFDCGISLSVLFGDERVHDMMEPETPPYERRWSLAKALKDSGLYVGMVAEPVIPTINDKKDFYYDYAEGAVWAGVDHVNFGELRISNVKIAAERFKRVGLDLAEVMRRKEETWLDEGLKIFSAFETHGIPVSTPDWVNFGGRCSCEGCCGLDRFGVHHFTFQKALRLIIKNKKVTWDEMLEFNLLGEQYANRFRDIWNGKPGYYNLSDVPGVHKIGVDGEGNAIYGRGKTLAEVFK